MKRAEGSGSLVRQTEIRVKCKLLIRDLGISDKVEPKMARSGSLVPLLVSAWCQ